MLCFVSFDKKLIDRAADLGIEILQIDRLDKPAPGQSSAVRCTVLIDYLCDSHAHALVLALHGVYQFRSCFAPSEMALQFAAEVNAQLGLIGASVEAVRWTRDKGLMRERLRELGVSPIRFATIRSRQQAIAAAREFGFPLVAKPRRGVGGIGVEYLSSMRDLRYFLRVSPYKDYLLEEYLEGDLYSVEALTLNREHQIYAICGEFVGRPTDPGRFVNRGVVVPAKLSLSEQLAVKNLVHAFLNAINLQSGPSHTEVILTQQGPKIIESQTRMGGGSICDLVELATGVDLRKLTLQVLHGEIDKLPTPPPVRGAAAVRYLTPDPGRISSVVGGDLVLNRRGVVRFSLNAQIGDMAPVVAGPDDRLGYVMAVGSDSEEALQLCNDAAASVRIVIAQ